MKKLSNKKCDVNCVVHNLVTHNTCIFCDSARNSPYLPEFKKMSDDEILKIRKEVEKEAVC